MTENMTTEILIDTDKTKLNIEFIASFISQTYWAKGRTISEMQTCIDNSLNFGVYLNGTQIGYGRVVTDFVQFAYLMDVFIIEEQRGKEYSKILMKYIMNYPKLEKVKVWRLATTDAHKLYEQFGFKPLANPEKMMELKK
jgi:GNAT superfamily N-acetyltransferase